MRWKLIILTATIAAGLFSLIAFAAWSFKLPSEHEPYFFFAWLLTLMLAASIYIYRHTPRRRRIQAILTALFVPLVVFIFTILVISTELLVRNLYVLTSPLSN